MTIMADRKAWHWKRREINQEERRESRSQEETESKVGAWERRDKARAFILLLQRAGRRR